jgi:hypothetical protein
LAWPRENDYDGEDGQIQTGEEVELLLSHWSSLYHAVPVPERPIGPVHAEYNGRASSGIRGQLRRRRRSHPLEERRGGLSMFWAEVQPA